MEEKPRTGGAHPLKRSLGLVRPSSVTNKSRNPSLSSSLANSGGTACLSPNFHLLENAALDGAEPNPSRPRFLSVRITVGSGAPLRSTSSSVFWPG